MRPPSRSLVVHDESNSLVLQEWLTDVHEEKQTGFLGLHYVYRTLRRTRVRASALRQPTLVTRSTSNMRSYVLTRAI
jgi:hypothetical protein